MTIGLKVLIERHLIEEEGFRTQPYDDATGRRIKAIGHVTIGVGRNLDANPLSERIILDILNEDIISAWDAALIRYPDMPSWEDARQIAIISMVFNLGPSRYDGFRKHIQAVKRYDWQRAADEALDSRWANQVPKRAQTIARLLRTGEHEYDSIDA